MSYSLLLHFCQKDHARFVTWQLQQLSNSIRWVPKSLVLLELDLRVKKLDQISLQQPCQSHLKVEIISVSFAALLDSDLTLAATFSAFEAACFKVAKAFLTLLFLVPFRSRLDLVGFELFLLLLRDLNSWMNLSCKCVKWSPLYFGSLFSQVPHLPSPKSNGDRQWLVVPLSWSPLFWRQWTTLHGQAQWWWWSYWDGMTWRCSFLETLRCP